MATKPNSSGNIQFTVYLDQTTYIRLVGMSYKKKIKKATLIRAAINAYLNKFELITTSDRSALTASKNGDEKCG